MPPDPAATGWPPPSVPPSLRTQALAAMRRTTALLPPMMAKLVSDALDFMSSSYWIGDQARLEQLIAEVHELEKRQAA